MKFIELTQITSDTGSWAEHCGPTRTVKTHVPVGVIGPISEYNEKHWCEPDAPNAHGFLDELRMVHGSTVKWGLLGHGEEIVVLESPAEVMRRMQDA